MKNFIYHAPTKILFGKETELKCGEHVKRLGAKKVLLHYGSNSAKNSGLLDRVAHSLDQEGIQYVVLGGVVPNPRLSKVYEGIDLCKKENVDFVLAVGGGSVIDSAKAIGYGAANEADVWDIFVGKADPVECLPIGAVLTIAAAGSEMSNSSVITNEQTLRKIGYMNELCRCKFSVLNPELTYTLPAYQTACGCVDIMMHTMERYFSPVNPLELTDQISEGLLRTVMQYSRIALDDPQNYEARAEIMWAGSIAHNDLTGCGAIGDWASHMLEHELSALFDVAHGAGLAAVWSSWARYVYKSNIPRFARFARNVLKITVVDDEQAAILGIAGMEDYFHSIGMPINISELGLNVSDDQIDLMASQCTGNGRSSLGSLQKLSEEDINAIFKSAK